MIGLKLNKTPNTFEINGINKMKASPKIHVKMTEIKIAH